jgi:3-hydroxybutyryl-CoA dehydrogenase
LSVKREVLGELAGRAGPRTLLATNTSSLSIAKLAAGLKHPERFLGMHFFNPAPVMQVVELVAGPATGDQAMVAGRAICTKLGKTAVRVKDSPGFIGNRVNRPFYLEALRLAETGEADIRSIDRAVKEVGGFRMGPFELLDLIGLDLSLRVTEAIYGDLGEPARLAPSALQQELVAQGHLGGKVGRGFYHNHRADGELTPAFEAPLKDRSCWKPTTALGEFAGALGRPADRAMWVYSRIFAAVVNEAALVAETIALPQDVDLTMELGFNYPQGPLAMADHVGLDVIRALLDDYGGESDGGQRFQPSPLLERRVAAGNFGEKTARGFLHHAL